MGRCARARQGLLPRADSAQGMENKHQPNMLAKTNGMDRSAPYA